MHQCLRRGRCSAEMPGLIHLEISICLGISMCLGINTSLEISMCQVSPDDQCFGVVQAHGRTGGLAQEWVRNMLGCVGRGGNAQAIRDEILNIMHRNHIGEKRGTWMEVFAQACRLSWLGDCCMRKWQQLPSAMPCNVIATVLKTVLVCHTHHSGKHVASTKSFGSFQHLTWHAGVSAAWVLCCMLQTPMMLTTESLGSLQAACYLCEHLVGCALYCCCLQAASVMLQHTVKGCTRACFWHHAGLASKAAQQYHS